MQVTINRLPPPLCFGTGADAFKILLGHVSGADRMDLLDAALSASYATLFRQVERLVMNWQDVIDENGNPIPIEFNDVEGRPVKQFGKVMGKIPMRMQLQVVAGVLSFVGFPAEQLKLMAENWGMGDITIDPTQTPDGTTPKSASGD